MSSVAAAAFAAVLILMPTPLLKSSLVSLKARNAGNADSTEHLANALEAALRAGQTDRANQALARIMQRVKTDPDAVLGVGIRLAQQEFYAEASKVFARLVEEHPKVFEAHFNLAMAELAQGHMPAALAALQTAAQGSPEQELARLYLRGKIRNAQGQTQQAEQDLSAAFRGAPDQANYALDLGMFYLQQKDYTRAAEVFEKAAYFNRDSPFLWLGLSLAQLLGGREAECIETCQSILKLKPDFSAARLLLVFALYMNGKLEDAKQAAMIGLQAAQPHPYLYYLDAVILLKSQSMEYDRMLDDLGKVILADPRCALCYVAKSKVLEAMGNSQEAISDLEVAIRLKGTLSEAWYHLARLYKLAGRQQDAARALEQFRKLKTEKYHQETEMIRSLFMQSMEGGETSIR